MSGYSCPPHYHPGPPERTHSGFRDVVGWLCALCGKEVISENDTNRPDNFQGPNYEPAEWTNASSEKKSAYWERRSKLAKQVHERAWR